MSKVLKDPADLHDRVLCVHDSAVSESVESCGTDGRCVFLNCVITAAEANRAVC